MKVNQVKQFVANNISRFEKRKGCCRTHSFDLYDKNNFYRGEYNFIPIHCSGSCGVKSSLSTTRILNDLLKQEMSEIVYMSKTFVTLKDLKSDTLIKPLASDITTVTTVMDYVNDKFKTVRTVSKLKNKLQRLGKNDPDFDYSDNFIIYEPLKEKPQYEKSIEYVREGSISEVNKKPVMNTHYYPLKGSINQLPYKFW